MNLKLIIHHLKQVIKSPCRSFRLNWNMISRVVVSLIMQRMRENGTIDTDV